MQIIHDVLSRNKRSNRINQSKYRDSFATLLQLRSKRLNQMN